MGRSRALGSPYEIPNRSLPAAWPRAPYRLCLGALVCRLAGSRAASLLTELLCLGKYSYVSYGYSIYLIGNGFTGILR